MFVIQFLQCRVEGNMNYSMAEIYARETVEREKSRFLDPVEKRLSSISCLPLSYLMLLFYGGPTQISVWPLESRAPCHDMKIASSAALAEP